MDNFYCSASADRRQTDVCATVRLPTPIKAAEYDVALVYCTFIPKWEAISELYLIVETDQGQEMVLFHDIYVTDTDLVLRQLTSRLTEFFGLRRDSAVRLITKLNKSRLYLKKNSKLTLSKTLASLLSLPLMIENDSDKTKAWNVNLNLPDFALEENVYFVSCDQLPPNFVSTNVSGINVLDVIQAHNTLHDQLVEHYANGRYYSASNDDSLLSTLYIRMLNAKGERLTTLKPKFYVLLHFKKKS